MDQIQIFGKIHWNILEFNIADLFKLVLIHSYTLAGKITVNVLIEVNGVAVLDYAPT